MKTVRQVEASPPPLVSIVIPACDRCAVLSRCLDALARQSYRNLEIIVVDDCSADDTPGMLREFAAKHPDVRLHVLRNETHSGANPSRNRGIAAASGEFVAFLDSDCIAEPDWLERLMAGFDHPRVAATTGRVNDPPPRNIYELTFKGTHRLHRPGPAHRLVAGNMCVRRALLLQYRLDEDRALPALGANGRPDLTVSGRGDEEGLFLVLRAAGYNAKVVPDAVVLHDHHLDGRSFFRQAVRGGRSAARLVYKYYLPPRLDLLPFLLAYATLPLMLLSAWLWTLAAAFFAGGLAALAYNDLCRKGKTFWETLRSFPMLLVYYHLRLFGYVQESVRLRITRQRLVRVRLGEMTRRMR